MKQIRFNYFLMGCKRLLAALLWVGPLVTYGQNTNGSMALKLPNGLLSQAGQPITSPELWKTQRRPELLRLFADNVYGELPTDVDSIRFLPVVKAVLAMNGQAMLKQVAIRVSRKGQSLTVNLLLFIPVNRSKPAPVFLLINHRDADNTDPGRLVKREFWPAEEVIARGYAVAAFQVSDVAPDNAATYGQGVLRLYPEQQQQTNGMKAIGAWAWGASRVMDYLVTDPDIDPAKVAVVGHSRGGKAALWCGAQDQRFAITISNNSGCTGAALSRRKVGERVANINKDFPYWFCDNYTRFNEKEEFLPIDQHELIALIAPRAVYVASASEDAWADPAGEFLSLKYAEPVFNLFRVAPLPVLQQPAVQVPVRSAHMGYHLRKGGHGLFLYDWERFMDFADAHYAATATVRK